MMDVDQPVSSTTGDAESSQESSQANIPDKSPGMIVRESDDLPALLISDSEEDDPPKYAAEEKKADDITGITPIETTVVKASDQCDDTGNESTICSTFAVQETSALSAVDEEEISLVENIDLTGVSSAEDSGVNEPSSERTTTPPVVKAPTLAKPSSEMTAQELLESLLEAQEEAFACQRASLSAEKELKEASMQSKAANASETGKITKSNLDCTLGENAKETMNQNAGKPGEDSSPMASLAVDDVCLLEEMVNAPETQREMDIDEHRTGTNSSPCSDDGSGANHNSDDTEQASALRSYSNDDILTLSEKVDENSDDMLECTEPPRKRARSTISDSEPELKAGATDTSFHGIEHDIVQNEKLSEGAAKKPDNLRLQTEQSELHPGMETNLSAVEPEPASDPHADKPQTVTMVGSSDTSNHGSDGCGPQKKQCIEVGGQKNVQAVEASVCPDVFVIDDDEDETEVTSNKIQDTNEKKTDSPVENNLQTDENRDPAVKSSNVDTKSPVPEENMEVKPMAMEFLRRFNKPIALMTRTDLEQLVLQKLSEAIVHQSENAELRRIIKRQSLKLQGYERTIVDMSSHYEGLKLVAERAVEDMKKRAKSFVAPVKITRAVGLQVSRPAIEMAHANKSSNLSRIMPEKRKNSPATATVTTNGAIENRAQTKPSELANQTTQQSVPFSSGQQNTGNINRSQHLSNVSPMTTTRLTPNSPLTNGMMRTLNSQVGKHSNSGTTTSVSITPANTVKLAPVHTNDGSGVSIANSATFANPSPNTSSAANSIAGAIDSPARKKFHKFTPKRPPLSPYQQAQQEKQVRQQQELLVQQIHEQSQQAQRKAQITVRSDLPTLENSAARSAMDAAARQRSITQQGRLLNTNVQNSTQSFQIVPLGGLRAASAMPNSTTIQMSQAKSNAQPTTTVASSVNDSLIDLTDEDDTTGKEGSLVSPMLAKRMKPTHGGSFTSTPPIPGNPSMQTATNQFIRLQSKINTVNGSEIAPAVATSTSVGGMNQLSGALVRGPMNVNRSNNALQPLRQPIYNSNMPRLPASSTDTLRKRVVIKPLLAPLPHSGPQPSDPTWKQSPPQPSICVNNVQAGIVISWTMPSLTDLHADIETYQIYAYQELSIPTSPEEWRHVGDVKALLLPMAVTLTQFHEGQRYYFAVRAIDVHKRVGKFCEPRTWNETNVSNI